MEYPHYLQEGDRVAVVATARKVSREDMAPAVELLRSWGLRVVEPEGLYAECHQMAGSDECRAAMLQEALDDESIRAVFCARGGYGTVRIVDRVDFSRFVRHPKWVVGYSDVTVLHSHIARHWGIPTMHAIMPINIPANAAVGDYPAIGSLHDALFGAMPLSYPLSGPCPMGRAGKATGPVVGGNLSILYSLLASDSDVDTRGRILMIEDLDEYLYHIDRMMMALKRAGRLAGLRGLIVGALSDMHDNTVPFGRTAEEIVWDAVREYGYPVCFHAKFGHIGTENLALPMGVESELEVSNDGSARLVVGRRG
jgi:muramoyltetrapeptide carboxypeptidase